MKNKILVIIPAYNEEESIEKVVSNLENDFSFYDYVVINDGSKDATPKIMKELAKARLLEMLMGK